MSRATRNPVRAARRRPSVNALITGIVVLLAVVVIGGVLLVSRDSAGTDGGADTRTLRPAGSHTLTEAADGRVTIVEFVDFQCPACASYYTGVTRDLERDYAGRITLVPRNFPLEIHPLAVPAASAAEAAGMQGEYEGMFHALYDTFDSWAVTADGTPSADRAAATTHFDRLARRLGLDLDRFRTDAASAEVREAVDRGIADGRELGVDGTPTFFVNGERFDPRVDTLREFDRELRARIDAELAS